MVSHANQGFPARDPGGLLIGEAILGGAEGFGQTYGVIASAPFLRKVILALPWSSNVLYKLCV